MEDSLLLFRNGATAGNLTVGTTTSAWLDLGGIGPHAPMTVQLIVPAFVAATTLQVTIEEGDDGVNPNGREHTFPLIDAAGEVGVPYELTVVFKSRYARAEFVAVGAAANFGPVHCAPVLGGLYDRY